MKMIKIITGCCIVFLLLSCRKERTCVCNMNNTTYKAKSSKRSAKEWCEAMGKSTYVQTNNGVVTSTGQISTDTKCTLK
jgi:major membrane immunogen (membrane-anchored lipoprotein)